MMVVTRSDRRSSLCHPVPTQAVGRQSGIFSRVGGCFAPAVRSIDDRATPVVSDFRTIGTMTKLRPEIDSSNPFIPSHSPVCRLADQMMIVSVVLSGLVAAIIAVAQQVTQ